MNNKNLTSILFILTLTFTLQTLCFNTFTDQPWEFVEYEFITKPARERLSLKNTLLKIGISGIASFFTGKLVHNFIEEPDTNVTAINLFGEGSQTVVVRSPLHIAAQIGIFSMVPYFFIVDTIHKNRLDLTAIKTFIHHWPTNKAYIPTEFHAAFDSLYEAYLNNTVTDDDFYETLHQIRQRIYQQFPDRYENQLKLNDAAQPVQTVHLIHW